MSENFAEGKNVFLGNKIEAVYNHEEEAMYKHNAFIEALPYVRSEERVASLIRRKPAYDEKERLYSAHRRLQLVQTIANFIEPLPVHIELEQRFSRMIRNGYVARNPISSEWIKQIRSGFPDLDWGEEDKQYAPIIRSTASGFTIIGTSGIGKSTAIESILSLYPQVIIHTQYKDSPLDRQQLVWLKLDCTPDGSIKGLCLNFFQAIDTILGTNYEQKFGNNRSRTVDELLPTIAKLSSALGLGVLVIDEIQRISLAKSGGAEKILNFFVQLINTMGVPVVLVGTFKAMPLITSEFSHARRSAGQGDLIWSNFVQDECWDFFVECLWKYQWTNVSTPLTQKIKDVLYDESQGITDIAVKLYMLAQWSVIGLEDEIITTQVIRDVAKEGLKLSKPILDALRSRDIEKLKLISDVEPPMKELNEYFDRATSRVLLEGTLNTLRNQQKSSEHENEEGNLVVQIAEWLVAGGVSPKEARECAIKALEHFGQDFDLQLARKNAFTLAQGGELHVTVETKKERKRKAKDSVKVYFPDDIRGIALEGEKNEKAAYEALKMADVIKEGTQFINF